MSLVNVSGKKFSDILNDNVDNIEKVYSTERKSHVIHNKTQGLQILANTYKVSIKGEHNEYKDISREALSQKFPFIGTVVDSPNILSEIHTEIIYNDVDDYSTVIEVTDCEVYNLDQTKQ